MVLMLVAAGCAPLGAAHREAPTLRTAAESARACDETGDAGACARAAELAWDGKDGGEFDVASTVRRAARGCNGGNPRACALWGRHHESGIGTTWEPGRAVALYDMACTAGDGLGCFGLAGMYRRGHGVDADVALADTYTERALAAWRAACRGAEPRWCTYAAWLLRDDAPAARELYQHACDRGIASGCVRVVAARSAPTPNQWGAKVRQLEELCDRGEPAACSAVADMEQNTPGGKVAVVRSFQGRACQLGDANACLIAGILYDADRAGGDAKLRLGLLALGCDRGSATACLVIAEDLAKTPGHAADVTQFVRRSCQMGEVGACERLSRIHLDGDDLAAATRWGTEACRLGSMSSCERLVKDDRELPALPLERRRWLLRRGCDDGATRACEQLAKLDHDDEALYHAVHEAIANQDTAAFARLAPRDIEVSGLWFEPGECAKQFAARRVVSPAQQPPLLACLAGLGLEVQSRRDDQRATLVYEPGVAVTLDMQGGAIRRIFGPAPPSREVLGPIITPARLHAHDAALREVEPGASVRNMVSASPTAHVSAQVSLCVDPTGKVNHAKIVESSRVAEYDRAVQAAVATWTFTPFVRHGKPITVCTSQAIVYPPDRGPPGRPALPGLGKELATRPDGGPVNVPPNVVEANRIAGERNITPDDHTRTAIFHAGHQGQIVGSFKLCLSTTGRVTSVTQLKSTGWPAYDARIEQGIRAWRYLPFLVDGTPAPVCTAVTFIYTQR
jgi:TonB family protein